MNLQVTEEPFELVAGMPDKLLRLLVKALTSIPQEIFFGLQQNAEVVELDSQLASGLQGDGLAVTRNCPPFGDNRFNVDIAIPSHKTLIEIEKGRLPRLELDILKIASACVQAPEQWEFGVLIVPSSYIQLPLEGRQTPYQYLRRLRRVVQPILERSSVRGFAVIGYVDPRPSKSPKR